MSNTTTVPARPAGTDPQVRASIRTAPGFLDDATLTVGSATARWLTIWDGRQALGWLLNGVPAFRFRWAPSGLATRRQLREQRMCPGGHEPYAVLVWRHGQRWAWLYRLDLAKPSCPASVAKLAALHKAMAARRRCRACGQDAGYCVPVSDGRCVDCIDGYIGSWSR